MQHITTLLGATFWVCKNIEDPLPGFMTQKIKYKRSLVKCFKDTMSFRQTELLSSTDKNVKNKSERN